MQRRLDHKRQGIGSYQSRKARVMRGKECLNTTITCEGNETISLLEAEGTLYTKAMNNGIQSSRMYPRNMAIHLRKVCMRDN
jgi:hypothetical protein